MLPTENEILLKCLELTRYMADKNVDFFIDIKVGEGKDEFVFNVEKATTMKKMSPSKLKRNVERKNDFNNKKLKMEESVGEYASSDMTKPVVKTKKTARFKVAANMRIAAQKVLETALSRVNPSYAKLVNYLKDESKWDLVGGDYSGEHLFDIELDEDGMMEAILDGIKRNWRSDPLPAELINAWII